MVTTILFQQKAALPHELSHYQPFKDSSPSSYLAVQENTVVFPNFTM
jgi:hypothetical protein